MELSNEQIEAAVEWWANDLRGPEHKNRHEEQEMDKDYLMEKTLANMARSDPPSENQIEKFKDALREELNKEQGVLPYLSVDYHPCKILREALEKAEINPRREYLSIKTNMRFECGGVQVSHGYGREYEELVLRYPPDVFCGECGHSMKVHIYGEIENDNRKCIMCECKSNFLRRSTETRIPTDKEHREIEAMKEFPEVRERVTTKDSRSIQELREMANDVLEDL